MTDEQPAGDAETQPTPAPWWTRERRDTASVVCAVVGLAGLIGCLAAVELRLGMAVAGVLLVAAVLLGVEL